LIGWAVVPWGGTWDFAGIAMPGFLSFLSESDWLVRPSSLDGARAVVAVAPVNIGVVYILAVGSVAVYGIVLGAYASNNKYAFLGGLRATAQMLSYEIPMGICVLIMLLLYKSTDAGFMSSTQASSSGFGAWGLFAHPLVAIIFFVCLLAEANRAPFDLAEAEQELVGGFHTEYSSMKWALFFLGEYMHMITGCAFFAILFLGGWDIVPFVGDLPVVAQGGWAGLAIVMTKFGVFCGKIFFLLFVMMWVRWTLPRLRFDQLMKLAWRGMIPLMIVMLLVTGVMTAIDVHFDGNNGRADVNVAWYWYTAANVLVAVGAALIGPMLPSGPPVNRRVPLAGSRYSPLVEPAARTT
ncbi:MAG: complex I subunit 1 family protein, partial [Planctomycetota bacterium]